MLEIRMFLHLGLNCFALLVNLFSSLSSSPASKVSLFESRFSIMFFLTSFEKDTFKFLCF